MPKQMKSPVPHLLPRKAKHRHRVKMTAARNVYEYGRLAEEWLEVLPEDERNLFLFDEDEVYQLGRKSLADTLSSIIANKADLKEKVSHTSICIVQNDYRTAVSGWRRRSRQTKDPRIHEWISRRQKGSDFNRYTETLKIVTYCLNRELFHAAYDRIDATHSSVEVDAAKSSHPDDDRTHLYVTIRKKKRVRADGKMVEIDDVSWRYFAKPTLCEMYRAAMPLRGSSITPAAKAKISQHRSILGVTLSEDISDIDNAKVVYASFLHTLNSVTVNKGTQHGWFAMHPDIDAYGFGTDKETAVKALRKEIAKALTHHLRRGSK